MAETEALSGCCHGSTGSFWKPIYNLLEQENLKVLAVNAKHMKNVPGRKTDVKDAEWIADLLRHGLLEGSYIPAREQRELRELLRYRRSLIDERAWELNRIQKVLEGANIKLSSVASDILGKSGRVMIETMISGKDDPAILAEIGTDVGNQFGSFARLCSWAGIVPGNNESTGKRKSGRTRHGNQKLRSALVEAARAAAQTKNTYLSSQYHRIAGRRGANRAAAAVAHTVLTIAYYILTRKQEYIELGPTRYEERRRESVTKQSIKKLEALGYIIR